MVFFQKHFLLELDSEVFMCEMVWYLEFASKHTKDEIRMTEC